MVDQRRKRNDGLVLEYGVSKVREKRRVRPHVSSIHVRVIHGCCGVLWVGWFPAEIEAFVEVAKLVRWIDVLSEQSCVTSKVGCVVNVDLGWGVSAKGSGTGDTVGTRTFILTASGKAKKALAAFKVFAMTSIGMLWFLTGMKISVWGAFKFEGTWIRGSL